MRHTRPTSPSPSSRRKRSKIDDVFDALEPHKWHTPEEIREITGPRATDYLNRLVERGAVRTKARGEFETGAKWERKLYQRIRS